MIDEAGSRVRLRHIQLPEEARDLDKELRSVTKEKDAAVRAQACHPRAAPAPHLKCMWICGCSCSHLDKELRSMTKDKGAAVFARARRPLAASAPNITT